MSDSFAAPWTVLCPWDFPGYSTGMGCHFLLQGIFPTQGSSPSLLHLLHWQVGSLQLAPRGKSSGNNTSFRKEHLGQMLSWTGCQNERHNQELSQASLNLRFDSTKCDFIKLEKVL